MVRVLGGGRIRASRRTRARSATRKTGPRLVFADGTQSIYLADMSGDGLSDMVRIRTARSAIGPTSAMAASVRKVTMDNVAVVRRCRPVRPAPRPSGRHRRRGSDRYRLSGPRRCAALSQPLRQRLVRAARRSPLPGAVDDRRPRCRWSICSATAPRAWSGRSPLPGDARRPDALPRSDGRHQAASADEVDNNLGAETRVEYAPSTQFYLARQARRDARGSRVCPSRCTSSSG